MNKVVSISSLNTQAHAIRWTCGIRGHADDPFVLDVQIQSASHAAVRTRGGHDLVRFAEADGHLVVQGPGRAECHTGTTRFTARIQHGGIEAGDNLGIVAPVSDAPDESALYFLT